LPEHAISETVILAERIMVMRVKRTSKTANVCEDGGWRNVGIWVDMEMKV
jgi:ABC-type nitrate/sulfonate/bicarbonate transport system ATPase subunit